MAVREGGTHHQAHNIVCISQEAKNRTCEGDCYKLYFTYFGCKTAESYVI